MTVVPEVLCLIDQNSNRTSKTIKHLAVKCQYQERADVIGDFVTARCGKSGNCIIFAETKMEASELALSDNLSGNDYLWPIQSCAEQSVGIEPRLTW